MKKARFSRNFFLTFFSHRVVRSLARHNIEAGNSVLAYYNGFMGAAIGDSIHMKWRSVSNWVNTGARFVLCEIFLRTFFLHIV